MVKRLLRKIDREYAQGLLTLVYHLGAGRKAFQISQTFRNPIIIGGCGRSGTGLLLSLLSVHPNIYSIPDETKAFCPGAYSAGEFPGTHDDIDEYSPNPVDPEEVTFLPDFIASRLAADADTALAAKRWCEKTPKNILFAEQILDYFGKGARFVHIVRDGRNVVTSRHPGSPDSYYVPPKRWVKDVSAARRMEDHSQFYTVRYEDLTNEPEDTLREVFDVLEEPFPRERLQAYPESSQFSDEEEWLHPGRRQNILGGLREKDHERYRKDEHRDRVDQLLSIPEARDLLTYYGYTL